MTLEQYCVIKEIIIWWCALNCRREYEEEDNSSLKYNVFSFFVTGFVKSGNDTDPQSHLQHLCSTNSPLPELRAVHLHFTHTSSAAPCGKQGKGRAYAATCSPGSTAAGAAATNTLQTWHISSFRSAVIHISPQVGQN